MKIAEEISWAAADAVNSRKSTVSQDEQAEKAVEYYREYFKPHGIFENEVYDGIPELLYSLKAQGKILIVGNIKAAAFCSPYSGAFQSEPLILI